MIPKVIHYCWFGGKPLPDDVKKCIKTWEKFCPDYEIKRWDEKNFDVYSHPFIKSAYEAKAWAFVSDYARLKIVYDEGGIYLDTDVELLKNLDFLLEYKFYIGVQQQDNYCTTGLGFGAEKNSPIVESMLKVYDSLTYEDSQKTNLSCPALNDGVVRRLGNIDIDNINIIDGCCILPPRYMDPIAPGDNKNLICNDSISIHHYSASWVSGFTRLKRKCIRAFGEERYHKIKKMIYKNKNL
ncbi:MAG: glycosyltransferase family 32 protein [Lachnospira sp.]